MGNGRSRKQKGQLDEKERVIKRNVRMKNGKRKG